MKKMRHLGQTDLEVTPIGLGVWQFAGGKGMSGSYWPALPQDVADGIVKTSLDGGVNWFDTAEIYGNGQSERSLAGALKSSGKADGDVIIATKWWPLPRTARSISGTIGKRLKALGGFSIDLHQIHQPWSMSSVEAEMEEMADLVESGKIRSVGVSNFSAKRMRKAHKALSRRGLKLASNQIRYNLLYRKAERDGVFETARELGITIIAWSPLEQGVLTGKFHRDPSLLKNVGLMRKTMFGFSKRALERSLPLIETLEEIAAAHDVTPTQVTLNWVVNFHGETVVAIPGASKVSHAVQNAGSMNFALSEEEMERIDRVSRRLR
jgi:aryl-alcohol dehydrogenase-like predicted oxidoreductase